MDISENVTREARRRGITLNQIAERLEVSRMQIYRYLHNNVTTDNLKRIADAIGTTPAALLTDSPQAPGPQKGQNQEGRTQAGAPGPVSIEATPPAPCPGLIICPHCGRPIQLQTVTAGQDKKNNTTDKKRY